MPRRELLSPAQRAEMLALPSEMSEQMLARYYTLSSDDLALIAQRRRSSNRLGFTVQLAYHRFPGRTWTASEVVSPGAFVHSHATRHRSHVHWTVCA
jgi:TnpA family transposase